MCSTKPIKPIIKVVVVVYWRIGVFHVSTSVGRNFGGFGGGKRYKVAMGRESVIYFCLAHVHRLKTPPMSNKTNNNKGVEASSCAPPANTNQPPPLFTANQLNKTMATANHHFVFISAYLIRLYLKTDCNSPFTVGPQIPTPKKNQAKPNACRRLHFFLQYYKPVLFTHRIHEIYPNSYAQPVRDG